MLLIMAVPAQLRINKDQINQESIKKKNTSEQNHARCCNSASQSTEVCPPAHPHVLYTLQWDRWIRHKTSGYTFTAIRNRSHLEQSAATLPAWHFSCLLYLYMTKQTSLLLSPFFIWNIEDLLLTVKSLKTPPLTFVTTSRIHDIQRGHLVIPSGAQCSQTKTTLTHWELAAYQICSAAEMLFQNSIKKEQ